ncbi:hypothetical protein GCM10007388_10300 [Pseudoduganella plicata]|uniref:Uncharacterized protein n=1 Tax=Pseudoduganella plicata TaxID=321984 RepID=A0AA87Y2P2_9BURK|nr:hypothetical protein GCM10007388_10300 [Pseudoduganella plicata]
MQLRATIDAARMARLEVALEARLYQRLMLHRARFALPGTELMARLRKIVKWTSAIGLVTTLGLCTVGGLPFGGWLLDVLVIAVYAALLSLSMYTPYWEPRMRKPGRFWQRQARWWTDHLLKNARTQVPFDAQYDFADDMATYFRIRDDTPHMQWTRRLEGFSLSGEGFTVLYRSRKSLSPHAFFLHEPSAPFEALLAHHGVQPLPGC